MQSRTRLNHRLRAGFSLVELLVVIGIIAILLGILLPAMNRARAQAKSVQCMSNLRQCGIFLQTYLNENRGWLFPVDIDPLTNLTKTIGTDYPPNKRWPMRVPGMVPHPPQTLPFNEASYHGQDDPAVYVTLPFTPPILVCPSDEEPKEGHSYVLNKHLADLGIRMGKHDLGGLTTPQVVVMGEKKTDQRDYYMERAEFDRVVENYRHGIKLGSNYLKMDWHVDTLPPNEALAGTDPWDLHVAPPTTEPTS